MNLFFLLFLTLDALQKCHTFGQKLKWDRTTVFKSLVLHFSGRGWGSSGLVALLYLPAYLKSPIDVSLKSNFVANKKRL